MKKRRHQLGATSGGESGGTNGGGESCAAVESVPGRLSGAWVFRGTRVPVSSLFGNLAEGATVEEFLDWFPGVEAWQVKAVLEHEVEDLDSQSQA